MMQLLKCDKSITFRVDSRLYNILVRVARKQRCSVSDLVRKLLYSLFVEDEDFNSEY